MPDPILIIQHHEAEGTGLLGGPLEASGRPLQVRRVWRGEPIPRAADGLAAVVIMGGAMGVYEAAKYPHLTETILLAADALRRGTPILGVCLGSQILAAAAGARVYPGGGKEIGWFPIALTAEGRSDPVLGRLAPVETVFHWHGDTFDAPPGSVHLASSEKYARQAYRIGRRAYGLQFHLEITEEMVDRFLEAGMNEAADFGGAPGAERIRDLARRYAPPLAARARAVGAAFLAAAGLA